MGAARSTYMAHAKARSASKPSLLAGMTRSYAGVALGCVEAFRTTRHYTGERAEPGRDCGMADDDVVEVGCWVDGSGIRASSVGKFRRTSGC